jgi:hypothetical protein
MLYYCENCHILNEHDYCKNCGKKKLRNPENNDYCFLIEVNSMFGEAFGGLLKGKNIPYSAMPSGNWLRTYFALKLENLKIFVPYEFFDKAKELLNEILANYEEEQKSNLKIHIDKLFISPHSEKKMKKILKIYEKDSLIDYCEDKIINADKIVNKGKISSCSNGGNYLFVYKDNELFIINSATYEIISAKKRT